MEKTINKDKAIDDLLLLVAEKNKLIKVREEQLKEEFSRGVKEGLSQAADIVKNC